MRFVIKLDLPDLHAAGPVAHVLSQQKVVDGARADEVENLEMTRREVSYTVVVQWVNQFMNEF